MNNRNALHPFGALGCIALLALTACATRAPDFAGRWRDANTYAQVPQEIPLRQPHVFAASPMDGTLRNLLQRWTRDAGLRFRYEHASDYTLHAAVAKIHSSDLQQAVDMLNQAYAAQGIFVEVADGVLSVRPAAATTTAATP